MRHYQSLPPCRPLDVRTQSSRYLSSLALNEEVNPLMLISQLPEELVLECLKSLCLSVAAGYSSCLTLTLGGADLDKVLDVIVIDIV